MAKFYDRHFQFLASSNAKPSGRLWLPAADVYETQDGWVVKVELAGVAAEDVEIDVQGNNLHIAGCRKDRTGISGASYHQMEITYSRFEKNLQFPASIENVVLDHMFENGLLIIRLKKVSK